MTNERLRRYSLAKIGAYEDFPFGELPVCYRVGGRIFVQLYPLPDNHKITLRCDPGLAAVYRAQYPADVAPGYHCPDRQKPYHNTVYLNRGVSDELVLEMIDHSYDQALLRLRRRDREALPFVFAPVVNGWDDWSRVFQSLEDFAPLAERIFAAHGLPYPGLSSLTPGTNAVFRAGEAVVKIMAPAESGLLPNDAEFLGLRHAAAAGAPGPALLCGGVFRDRYAFPYLVTAFLEGREAGDALPGLPDGDKRAFAARLRELTDRLQALPPPPGLPADLRGQFLANTRWDGFPENLRRDILRRIEALPGGGEVFVHGDLTGENVLLGPGGELRLLDFGDCHRAPAEYEWPPLVFELFRGDPVLLRAYFGEMPADFHERLALAVAYHDFGGYFARDACRETGTPQEAVRDMSALRDVLARRLRRRDVRG